MKAILLSDYGPPESLRLKHISKPDMKPDEVLIKIKATAINDYDWSLVRGRPLIYRLMFGLFKPKIKIPGMELAGIVEAIGDKVTRFKKGDPVYGDTSAYGFGTFAEYMSINEKALVKKPEFMRFEDAVSFPHALMLAYQGLVEVGQIKKHAKVLINGAGGGVGTFGLQIAKQYEAEVTGVDSGEKLAFMKGLGFDLTIDYRNSDFTKDSTKYDLILDTKTSKAPISYLRVLNTKGVYVTVGGTLGRLLLLFVLKKLGNQKLKIVSLKPNKNLEELHDTIRKGKITTVIDGPHALEDIPRLIRYFGEGKHQGKIVVRMND